MADRKPLATPAPPSRRHALATLGTAAGTVLAWQLPTAARAATTKLQCAGAYTDALFHTRNLQQFASEVGTLSQGGMQIDVVTNAKLMPMTDVLPALSKGELAMGEIFMSNFSRQYPLLGIDSLPFIVRSFDDAKRLWDATRQATQELLQKQGIRVLYAAAWPGQGLFARAPVNQLSDVKGQKFRVNNDATKYIAELSGATPVDIAANNLAQAIQGSQVDVMVTSSTTGVDSQSWNAMGIFVDMRAWIPKNLILMSEKHWSKLPEEAKKALGTASKQAEARGWQLARDADDAAQRVLAERGTKIAQPSYELRRTLDLIGEKFAREWSSKAGMGGASALISYYFPKTGA